MPRNQSAASAPETTTTGTVASRLSSRTARRIWGPPVPGKVQVQEEEIRDRLLAHPLTAALSPLMRCRS